MVLVEDDVGVRRAIERMLSGSGYQVSAFDSGEALLDHLHGAGLPGEGRCLVCDVRLPGVSGFELHRRLSEKGPTPPCIFITAHDDAAVRSQVEDLHAEYLLKPFEGRALLAKIALAVQGC